MPQEIQISYRGDTYVTHTFTFTGGELQVQIPGMPDCMLADITVLARLQSAEALIRLILATEIISRVQRSGGKKLVIPYFPLRQTRPRDATH